MTGIVSFTRLLQQNSHDKVKKRAASLVKKWAHEFERDEKLGIMVDAYDALKSKGTHLT